MPAFSEPSAAFFCAFLEVPRSTSLTIFHSSALIEDSRSWVSHIARSTDSFHLVRGLKAVLEINCNTFPSRMKCPFNEYQNLRTRPADFESTRIGLSRHTHCPLSNHHSVFPKASRSSLAKGALAAADNAELAHAHSRGAWAYRAPVICKGPRRPQTKTEHDESSLSLSGPCVAPSGRGGSHVRKSQRGVTDEPRQKTKGRGCQRRPPVARQATLKTCRRE